MVPVRQLIIAISAVALSMHATDASMARITCHCEGGDIKGVPKDRKSLPL